MANETVSRCVDTGEANSSSSDKGRRKPWVTPNVIVGTMTDTAGGIVKSEYEASYPGNGIS